MWNALLSIFGTASLFYLRTTNFVTYSCLEYQKNWIDIEALILLNEITFLLVAYCQTLHIVSSFRLTTVT
jgi:hypothetical protein